MVATKKNLKSTKEIAEIFGRTERWVQQLAKEKIIPVAHIRPYQFDLNETVQSYFRYLSEKASGREQKDASTEKSTADKLRAEADLKKYKAEIARLQFQEIQGKMHRSEDVKEIVGALVYTVRSMIMALPGRVAMDVVNVKSASEASEIIRAECYEILNRLADYKYDPEEYRRRVKDRTGWDELPTDEDDGQEEL